MLKNALIVSAVVCATAVGIAQSSTPASSSQQNPTQQPATQPANPPATPAPAAPRPTPQASAASATTTLTGCVYREQDVPGRTPNLAERAGIGEDYILSTMAASATAPSGATPTGTAGSSRMYKLEMASDTQLKSLVGKRVEVTGRVDQERSDTTPSGAAAPDRNIASPDKIELPEFEVASIKEVSGACPSAPARR